MQNLIVGIVGNKGEGKSTKLRELIADEKSLVVVDTLGEHLDWCPMCPGETLREQVEMLAEPPDEFRWSFLLDPDDWENNLNFLCKAAYRAGGMTVVIEEADNFSVPNRDVVGIKLLVNYGRHRGINIVWLARNPGDVSRRLTGQTDVYVLFRTNEPLFVDKLAKRLTPEIAAEIKTLPKFHYLISEPGESSEVIRGVTHGETPQV